MCGNEKWVFQTLRKAVSRPFKEPPLELSGGLVPWKKYSVHLSREIAAGSTNAPLF
jgi:hypothetical protein